MTTATSPTFGIRIPPCRSAAEVAECAVRAEAAGFDVAWIPDSQFLWRDAWASLALAAVRTERIRLGICVTNFETRHATVTAAAAATIDELAPGRFLLGVGSGDSAVKTLGLRPTRLARMREQIELVRALMRGDEVAFDGRAMRLEAVPAVPPPVYLAANGPKMLALAGEIADGVIFVGDIARARGHIGDRAVELCAGVICHVTADTREKARIVKPYAVAIAQTGGRELLREAGIDIDPPEVVGGIYPDMSHAKDWDEAAGAAEEWVDDELALRFADTYCLVGPPDECVRRFEQLADAGATHFYVRHFGSYTLPDELIAAFGADVILRFR